MNKKYIVPIALITSMTILQSPAYSQLDMPQVGAVQKFGFQPNANPAPTRGQPGLSDMMNAWEQETDPTKKKRLARQIQTRVGVAADGVIGQQTMRAIQQAGGQAGTSVVDFGGSQFRGNNPGQPAQGGFFGNLFAPRPAQPANPALGNMMREWELEPDPNKKRMIAMEIQRGLGVKADGVIGRQTMQAVQQAGGIQMRDQAGQQRARMSGTMGNVGPANRAAPGAGFSMFDQAGQQRARMAGSNPGQPAPGGAFGFNPNPGQPAQGGFFGNLFAPRPAQPANPALGNMMREWELEPDPNKKRMIAMEIQRDLGVKADGVIGNQTMQAIQQAGGMPGGGGMGGPAPQGGAVGSWTITDNTFKPNPGQPAPGGGFGFNPNPNQPAPGGGFGFNPNPNQPAPAGGGFFGKRPAGAPPPPGGGFGFNPNPGQPAPGGSFGFNPNPGQPAPGGGFNPNPGGGGMHGGMGDPGGGGMPGGGDPGPGGGGDPGPGGGGDPGGGPKN